MRSLCEQRGCEQLGKGQYFGMQSHEVVTRTTRITHDFEICLTYVEWICQHSTDGLNTSAFDAVGEWTAAPNTHGDRMLPLSTDGE
jgi:hypothetical protein